MHWRRSDRKALTRAGRVSICQSVALMGNVSCSLRGSLECSSCAAASHLSHHSSRHRTVGTLFVHVVPPGPRGSVLIPTGREDEACLENCSASEVSRVGLSFALWRMHSSGDVLESASGTICVDLIWKFGGEKKKCILSCIFSTTF